MKIGLIDGDNTAFPNLALMKISAYHKRHGDTVEFVNYWDSYDKVYISKVFTYTSDPLKGNVIMCDEIVAGGTGYNLTSKLPEDMEYIYPDYDLYPGYDFALGFLSRGCPRKCGFCVVSAKEGDSHSVANINDFWKGQKHIKLLDPNILACKDWISLFQQLIDTRAMIDFSQGLDLRLMDKKKIRMLLKMRIKRVHFAYDEMKYRRIIERKLREFSKETGWERKKVGVYVLTNYNTTLHEDLYRIQFIRDLNFQPYVMIYDKKNTSRVTRELSSWCNNPMFCRVEFEDWLKFRKVDINGGDR